MDTHFSIRYCKSIITMRNSGRTYALIELQWFSCYSWVGNMTRLVIVSRREWFNNIICSACRGSLIKGQAELEWFGSLSSPLLRMNVVICVRRVEWKIIAFIMQVPCTDKCSRIKYFYSQPGPCRLFSIKYEEQCFLQVSVKNLKQARTDMSCRARAHFWAHMHVGLWLFTRDAGVGIGLVEDVWTCTRTLA